MKRFLLSITVTAAFCLGVLPSAAQAGLRGPVVIPASEADNIGTAHPFHPDIQIIVTGVETATNELNEPVPSCSSSASYTLWFRTNLQPGTLTLNTAGSSYATGTGNSPDTVISLHMVDEFFAGFNNLDELACNDNGTSAAIINSFTIEDAGSYYIQVSAAPGVIAIPSSTVTLTATYTAAEPVPFDEPENARTLKFPGLPGVVGINPATLSLDEPVDPSFADPLTNTVWFKFTLTTGRSVQFNNFYTASAELWFSLFVFNGSDYVPPATGYIEAGPGFMAAFLDPGEYFLRVAVISDPPGLQAAFIAFGSTPFFMPNNYQFAVGVTEGLPGATENLDGWTLKNGDAGPTGDGAFCDSVPSYACYFQLASSGADEKTKLKSNLPLTNVKIKKGDLITLQTSLIDAVGTPDFTVTLKLTDANGVSQKYTLAVTDADNDESILAQATANLSPVKTQIIIKNKDVVPGNRIEINSILAAAVRAGEGVLRGGTLKLPGGEIPAAWATNSGSPKGVLPVPLAPPAQ